MHSKAVISLLSLSFWSFLTVPTVGCFSLNIYYFPRLLGYSSSNSLFSLPPSTVSCAVRANTCRFNISIIIIKWVHCYCSHFHIAISNFSGFSAWVAWLSGLPRFNIAKCTASIDLVNLIWPYVCYEKLSLMCICCYSISIPV